MTETLRARFDLIHAASRATPEVPWEVRETRLQALAQMIHDHREAIIESISADFGHRASQETQLAEIFPTLAAIKHARRHGRGWMRKRRAPVALWFKPARAHVQPMPLGVVGIVAPWNYPLMLTAGPLVDAFAAGNRAMVKLSEYGPAFADWFTKTAPDYFAEDELAIITGDVDVAQAFTALPFDHLLFTGSTPVGRHVMRAASDNLTPVTLELGGKSPVVVDESADLDTAVARILTGKLLNAGQTCVAPDYVMVPRAQMVDFVLKSKEWVATHYPDPAARDYTTIINAAQYDRLTGYLDSAKAAGADLVALSDTPRDDSRRLLPPVIVQGLSPDHPLLHEEIFGPILPVLPYDDLDQAVRFIAARPRPLAFYVFSQDGDATAKLMQEVTAGGVSINETIMHLAQDELPFGGIGASGMGAYHGKHGFDRMSHLKAVFSQSRLSGLPLLAPPYGKTFKRMLGVMMRLVRP